MRDYAIASPRFWTGETGKLLRKLGRDYQVVGFYLFTCASSNMIGLYYLGLPTLCHEVGNLTLEGASKVLQSLSEVGYARYDEASEYVFVVNMAREQLGKRLVKKDNRHSGVIRLLEQARKTPFFQEFLQIYGEDYELLDVPSLQPLESPSVAPSKGQVLAKEDQDQDQEIRNKNSVEQARLNGVSEISENGGSPTLRIFDHWRTVHRHPKAQLDQKRRRIIATALKSYSETDLCEAISGYRNSPHHMGQNDQRQVYDDIELFLRDAKHIEAGLKFAKTAPRERGVVV